jgi:deoxyribodipyrimidine photo-lyase
MRIAWLHPDCLNMNCLNTDWLESADRAVFVFDDAQIEAAGWGMKRLMFLYETLRELPIEIYRGPMVETLLSLAGAGNIVTVATPDPWLRDRIAELQKFTAVEVTQAPVFAELEEPVDLRRFSRYWAKAEGKLLRDNE